MRAGVTLDGILLYGTGGAAWGRVVTTSSQTCPGGRGANSTLAVAASSTSTTDKAGRVAGAGVEHALNANWSAKAEAAVRSILGTISSSLATAGSVGVPNDDVVAERTVLMRLRLGSNHKFGRSRYR